VVALALAVPVAYLTGGRVGRVPAVAVRRPALVPVALAMQLAPAPRPWAMILLLGSFALLLSFVAGNLRRPGFPLMLVGLLLNLVVIGANAGMPVSRQALVHSGQQELLAEFLAPGGEVKHHLARPDTRLLPLGDVIAFAPPLRQVVSVGDVFVYGGGIWLLLAAMHGPRRRRAPARLGAARQPAGRPT
jgi:hypothetical protein